MRPQRVDVEGDEEVVEQVRGEQVVERGDVQAEDVVQVVQVVQVLGHQVGEPVAAPVAETPTAAAWKIAITTFSI